MFLDGLYQLGVKLLRLAGRLRILVAKQLDALLLHVNLLGQHAHLCGQLGLRTVILVERRSHGFHFSRQRLRLRYDVFDAAVKFRSAVKSDSWPDIGRHEITSNSKNRPVC